MKRTILIVLAVFLSGCQKKVVFKTILNSPTMESVAFAGQSNILPTTGLSRSFVATASADGKAVTPLECARGGSYLDEWKKGEVLYNNCVGYMKTNPPAALVWWQGEADAHDMALTLTWRTRFEKMVTDIRADLGYPIPVIFVRVGNGDNTPEWVELQHQQDSVQMAGVTAVRIDFAESYRVPSDVHYTPEGYRVIGAALALAYLD